MIQENISLKKYHTFGIDVSAKYFSTFTTSAELEQLFDSKKSSLGNYQMPMILGGGSNIIFTKHFDGLVLKNEIKGINLIGENDDHVYVKVGAGENWHAFVLHCLGRNWAGVENLSLIPG